MAGSEGAAQTSGRVPQRGAGESRWRALEGVDGGGGHRTGEGLWHWDSGVAVCVGSGRAPGTVGGWPWSFPLTRTAWWVRRTVSQSPTRSGCDGPVHLKTHALRGERG